MHGLGWPRYGSAPISRLLQARSGEGRNYGAAWTRPKTSCADKNQRSLIWSLSLKRVNIRRDTSLCSGREPHIQALAIGGKELPRGMKLL